MSEQRHTLLDPDGRPVATYITGERDGRPLVDLVERAPGVAPEHAAAALAVAFPGHVVAADERVGRALLAGGAALRRHTHVMTHDLRDCPEPSPMTGVALGPLGEVAPEALLPSWWAAYPPGHPDAVPLVGDEQALAENLLPFLQGEALGPVMVDASAAALSPCRAVVGALLVNDRPGGPPFGGPWVTEVWRDPVAAPRGLGAHLLRRALHRLAVAGEPGLSLAVTHGNPARATYERLGFVLADTSISVVIPDA